MATEALSELMRSYDIEQNGFLNKIEWVKLCSHDTINLSPELASALFDGLDTDADGAVRINDIMKELAAYESGEPVAQTPTRRSASVGLIGQSSVPSTPKTPRKIPHPVMPVVKESRGQNRRLWERRVRSNYGSDSGLSPLDWPGDAYTTKKEVTEDGAEVFSTTPIALNPRLKKLLDLETEISRSYPELLPTFNSVLDDIRKELLVSSQEKHTLEENYLKEKAARKQDLIRMENELELQIQRYEERARNEVQDKMRNEYDTMISAKEKEIADIQSQVEMLKAKIKDDEEKKQTRTSPDSTTMDQTNTGPDTSGSISWSDPSSPKRNEGRIKSISDQDNLQLILEQLASRENELSALKAQLEMQEKQIEVDKRELMNREEEKIQLYQQLQNMRELLKRMNGSNDDMYTALKEDAARSTADELQTPKPPERIFKVILVGDTSVGKSSFMHQFCDGMFYTKLRTTVGVDFRTRNLRVDNVVYTIQMWDTAGQEKFRSIVRTYFRRVDGVIIIYDVTMPESFRNVRSWMDSVMDQSESKMPPIIIVGNKIDLRDPQQAASCVSTETGRKFAESHEALFIETSACTAENVEEAVRILSREMKLGEDEQIGTVTLKEEPPKKNPMSTCCK